MTFSIVPWWAYLAACAVAGALLAGDYAGACDALLDWDKFHGKPLRGLALRRQRERARCLGQS